MHAPELSSGPRLIFSAGEAYCSAAFCRFAPPFITVSAVKGVIFVHLVAVARSYDLTLWQEIIANIIHSAVVIVTRISGGHVSARGGR